MSRGILITAVLGGIEIQINDQTIVLRHRDLLELLRRLDEMTKRIAPHLLKS
jgi:hypothetical protein